jgi:hypothetical protein
MIRRQLLIATGIIASVVITACSDTTGPKKPTTGAMQTAAIRAPHAGPATLVASINGGGTANMDVGAGTSHWGTGVKLFSDGSASGQFDCVDDHGSMPGYPGNVWGRVTSWSIDDQGLITLNVPNSKFVPIPGGHPSNIFPFKVTIQSFGGAGVGHWTLAIPDGAGGWFTVCFETLTSGEIVIRYA